MALKGTFIILFTQLIHISTENVVNIESSCQNSTSTTGACFTLKDCLLHVSSCIASNSVIEFDSRDYFTENLKGFASIKNKQNLTLRVKSVSTFNSETSLANIYCSNRLGIAFMNITSLKIVGIGFHNCGSPIPHSFYTEANQRQMRHTTITLKEQKLPSSW